MAPVYDYQCSECEHTHEAIAMYDEIERNCTKCGQKAKRIISLSGVNTANDDAPWIRSVLDVVDKESKAPHVAEFVKNPTRANYKRWMKGEGLRHCEPGEEHRRPQEPDTSGLDKQLWERHRERNKLHVRTR
jgi:putative FmdB family regulatory protein